MTRIHTPQTIAATPVESQPFLNAVEKSLGSVPNLFRLLATSPEALEGYLGLDGALSKGKLGVATRERIAIAIANTNGCDYCNAAHTFLAKTLAKLDEAEVAANRAGASKDAKAHAAVSFAVKVATAKGRVSEQDISNVRAAGFSNAEIIEIIGLVALNVLSNYVNEVFQTEVDFPPITTAAAHV
ncbi:carboxymuconolactone decarboxylase family protein [Pseudooctadecabacter jejudonensis]|uniref:Carboxymuconolactone decarboxylase family protein n=1 Tax=Pseudooctadecabacter jejudonensis TaxID=1391910 RepID=A0A1Y5TJ50_9RHOB|nr:peroxidase-related enzyme [Pseudooctadecabacter jejudonensis]SLN61587.1 Carboxymuconolactone decarboxylase family protein [Pseudooctadecabacter jejudonensis]